ncbi:hypothetical protein ACQ4PT_043529 [Festuca glaucescens]
MEGQEVVGLRLPPFLLNEQDLDMALAKVDATQGTDLAEGCSGQGFYIILQGCRTSPRGREDYHPPSSSISLVMDGLVTWDDKEMEARKEVLREIDLEIRVASWRLWLVLEGNRNDKLSAMLKTAVWCLTSPEKHFAEVIRTSIIGLGTDESSLTRGIVSRAEVDMKKVKEECKVRYKTIVIADIVGDTSGYYRGILLALIGPEQP